MRSPTFGSTRGRRTKPRGRRGPADDHLRDVVDTLLAGRVVPVLGSEVAEFAHRLAHRFEYPVADTGLPRVAQYVAVMKGSGPLYEELHEVLAADAPPTYV